MCFNKKCKTRQEIVNVNSNEPVLVRFSIKTSNCSGSCNNVNDHYAKLCFPDVVINLNVKGFNLMSRTNETRHIEWHKTCKCKYRLDASVCNNKQHWNEAKCRCQCIELIDKGARDKEFIWNPSKCECECDKSCDIGGYSNCNCRKRLVDKLVEKCIKSIDKVEISQIILAENKCSSSILCIALFSLLFTINIVIVTYFLCSCWYLRKDDAHGMLNTHTETIIY